jgi:hypothetical protein
MENLRNQYSSDQLLLVMGIECTKQLIIITKTSDINVSEK